MKVTISKWGNSLAIRLPKAYVESLSIKENEEVDLALHEDHIALTPQKVTLEKLLAEMDSAALHKEVDFGTASGKEVW